MQFKDYYAVLGVPRDATAADIKKAYRRLARKYHPDVSKETDAQARMQEVNEAHAVLSDAEKRAAYDGLGQGWRPGQEFHAPPGWQAGFDFAGQSFAPGDAADFSDFFAELFGRGARARPAGFGAGAGRGEDHYAKVTLEIADAFTGVTRQLTLRLPVPDGHGGLRLETRTLNVKIPRGVHEGQVIRLAGQGLPAPGGGTPGDLLLEVHFRPHERLRARGRDLHLVLPLAPWEAALGAVVPVELPGGAVKVRVPEGAKSGGVLRLRGRGIPGEPPGDVLLELQVVLPTAESARARQFYEAMARELDFDPRRGPGE